MIIGLGIDICETERIEKALDRTKGFREKIFTQNEIDYCEGKKRSKFCSYAARFAAKEAFSKALGTGIGADFTFHDIEIINDDNGKPKVVVLDFQLEKKLESVLVHLSLTHSTAYAVANVIIEKI